MIFMMYIFFRFLRAAPGQRKVAQASPRPPRCNVGWEHVKADELPHQIRLLSPYSREGWTKAGENLLGAQTCIKRPLVRSRLVPFKASSLNP
jgi:hypothetical protein